MVGISVRGTLTVGLLGGLLLGTFGAGRQQGSAPSPRTVTVEKTVPARQPKPRSTPTHNVGNLGEARSAFERAVEGYGNSNLEVAEVMEFANNYYAEVEEKDTGIGAMELLINRPGSRVYQEPGPNMMWNAKYGMMSGNGGYRGMMGPGGRRGGSEQMQSRSLRVHPFEKSASSFTRGITMGTERL